ncbi:MAG: PAS domain S-box protein [Chloroflexi bacterium]|nr:PAS domain S-box protein [Chloroflexota bacterium]
MATSQLSLIMSRLPGIMWTTDKDLIITHMSGAGLNLLNRTPQEYIGRHLAEITESQNLSSIGITEHLKALDGKIGHYELAVDRRELEVTVQSLLDEQGQIIGCVAFAIDITNQKEAERALAYISDRMILLNRVISLASSSLNVHKVLEVACQELAQTFGVPQVAAALFDKNRFEGEVVAEYLAPGCVSALGMKIPLRDNPLNEELIRSKNPVFVKDVSKEITVQDVQSILHERKTVSILIVPLTVRGEVVGSIGIDSHTPRDFLQDEIELAAAVALSVSQALDNSLLHQQLESQNERLASLVENRTAELQRVNERMTAILNGSSDAIIFTHNDGTIRNANEAFDLLFRYAPDEAFSSPIENLAEPPFDQLLIDTLRTAVQTGEAQRLTIMARRKDGTTFDADVALAPVPVTQNVSGGTVCSLRDITQLKEVERLKDRFVSTVSHELRTPITGILLGANSLHQHYARLSDTQRLEIIRRILDQSTSLAELIEGILSLSRFDLQRHRTEVMRVDMLQTVEAIVEEFRPAIQNKHLVFELDTPSKPILTRGSRLDFSRIWRNLIDNAIKYTDEGKKVSVVLTMIDTTDSSHLDELTPPDLPVGVYVVGRVSDSGRGIPAEDLVHLFTRFYRGNAAQSNIPGSGLGLSLVKEILTYYRGKIDVKSEPGQGSTFTFWLPADTEEQPL